jgi:hypothetical protein
VRRLWGALLFAALAIPASLSLPSARAAAGESCAMACAHGSGVACCCASGGAAASMRRCAPGDGGFVPAPVVRVVLPPTSGVVAPAFSGWLALVLAAPLLRGAPDRPDPVPRLLS